MRARLALVVPGTAVLAVSMFGMTIGAAQGAGVASSVRAGYDVGFGPSDVLDLTAPTYKVPGDPQLDVTYGLRVTLLEVREHARALRDYPPHSPVAPTFGRWVGVKLKATNTGSTGQGAGTLRIIGTNGKTYYPQDPTMPGCRAREAWPPQPLDPGQTSTGCDTFDLPVKVGVRAVTVNFGGWRYASANGRWDVLDRKPGPHRLKYVALGDSYSSGEGSGDYDKTEPRTCHRGADAWPRQIARQLPGLLDMSANGLIACSGEESAALLGDNVPAGQINELARLRQMRPAPTLMTLTIGGNDIGFTDILWDCFSGDCIADGTLKKAEADLTRERGSLLKDYSAISDAAPHAHLVVVGYPQLFPSRNEDMVGKCRPSFPLGFGFTNDERKGLNQLDANLNEIIDQIASRAGDTYLSVFKALAGHEACTRDPWIVSEPRPERQEVGHPTVLGQTAIAQKLFGYLVRHYGT
jgi:lysophospholipase L1-like esterase